jgi:hypothetical protein
MTEIIVSAKTTVYTTRDRDPNDSWDQGDTEGYVSDVIARVKRDGHKTEYWGDSVCKQFSDNVGPGSILFAVVADYSSGSTFGRDGGHASVLDAFEDEAEALGLQAEAKRVQRSAFTFNYGGKEYYSSWTGYFESLNSIDVWTVTVDGHSSKI